MELLSTKLEIRSTKYIWTAKIHLFLLLMQLVFFVTGFCNCINCIGVALLYCSTVGHPLSYRVAHLIKWQVFSIVKEKHCSILS